MQVAMTPFPPNQKIYHITHIDNMPQIVEAAALFSDAERIASNLDCEIVGISNIKRRRLTTIEVPCHHGTRVGEYVPFYFCPRSIMLYILHMANHPDLAYHGGQRPIVHLQADLAATLHWADNSGIQWAFSDRNAGASIASFYSRVEDFDKINWSAVAATDFRPLQVKEGKQAEFLFYKSFPWELIEEVGVVDEKVKHRLDTILERAEHRPLVVIHGNWYY
jgi:hypothetical protein